MNVLLIPDSFKDCLSSEAVSAAMREGLLQVFENATTFNIQASDGGEGFLDAIKSQIETVQEYKVPTLDPLGREIQAAILMSHDKKTAFIELAKASGLELLRPSERNPLRTSTLGTGFQLRSAIALGAKTIYIGLGGSATNDSGIGIAHAMGYQFLDKNGRVLEPIGENLARVVKIDRSSVSIPKQIEVIAVNDVLNPLFGKDGAVYTYGRQKGASEAALELLERGLRHLDTIVRSGLDVSYSELPGSGAAGGSAYGLKCFLDASFLSGVSLILKLARFNELLLSKRIDLIVTGEGRIDSQTAFGKLVHGVITEARPHGIPVMAVCGKLDLDKEGLQNLGLTAASQLFDPQQPPGYSYEHAYGLIVKRTAAMLRSSSFYS